MGSSTWLLGFLTIPIKRPIIIFLAVLCLPSGVTGLAQTPAPAPSPTPAVPQIFQDVILGESATNLVARRGEPMIVRSGDDTSSNARDYVYLSSDGNAVEFLHILSGNVVGVSAKASPFASELHVAQASTVLGISIGDPASKVEALPSSRLVSVDIAEGDVNSTYRGNDGRLYTFTSTEDKVSLVSMYMQPQALKKLPPANEPSMHGGASVADAIVLVAPDDSVRLQSEQAFFALHPCADNGEWHMTLQTRGHKDRRQYDVIDVSCSTNHAVRTFYFDVTQSLGRRL